MCVQGCASFPFRSLLSSAHPSTSDVRKAGLHVKLGARRSGGHTELPARSGLFCFLNNKSKFQLTVGPACRFFLDSEESLLCCLRGASAPFLSSQCLPPGLSRKEVLLSLHQRLRGGGELLPRVQLPGGGGQGIRYLLTPPLWPHLMPLWSSPASPGSLPG